MRILCCPEQLSIQLQDGPMTKIRLFKRIIRDGCLLWGIRVIIPGSLRERVLQELHEGHPGIVRMKSLARLHVWWPKLDQSIASVVRDCAKCQSNRKSHHCIRGIGQTRSGREFTSISPVHS